jgi:hypothetical protein
MMRLPPVGFANDRESCAGRIEFSELRSNEEQQWGRL